MPVADLFAADTAYLLLTLPVTLALVVVLFVRRKARCPSVTASGATTAPARARCHRRAVDRSRGAGARLPDGMNQAAAVCRRRWPCPSAEMSAEDTVPDRARGE